MYICRIAVSKMKRFALCTFILFLLIPEISFSYNQGDSLQKGTIRIRTTGFMPVGGNLIIALYDSTIRSMRSNDIPFAFRMRIEPVDSSINIVSFHNIPAGHYSIAVYHDANANGVFNIATEDYGHSNEKKVYYNLLTYKRTFFPFGSKELLIEISLENELKLNPSGSYRNTTNMAPIIAYTPESNLMIGANIIKLFKFKGADSHTRTSYMDMLALYTLRNQIILEQNYVLFANQEKYMFIGSTIFKRFPQYYYGIGNALPVSNKELISYSQFSFEHLALRKVYKKLYLGLGYRYTNLFNMSSTPAGVLDQSRTYGYNGMVTSAIQTALSLDSRNNIYNCSKGALIRIKANFNAKTIGSNLTFQTYEIDLRTYIKPFKNRRDVLAFQGYGYFSVGTVPWSEMGALGSDVIMRGYYSGRYRNKDYVAVQAEYRLTVNKLFGVVLFAGTGEVANDLNTFTIPGLKPNAGTGLRINIDRKELMNLRLDYGFGYHTSNFYFAVTEAF